MSSISKPAEWPPEAITALCHSLRAQGHALFMERDNLRCDTLSEAELQAAIDAIDPDAAPPKPRHYPPYEFLNLFTQAELIAVMQSTDPVVIIGRTKVQTIITYIDLNHTETQQLVGYMEQIGLLAEGRAAEILS